MQTEFAEVHLVLQVKNAPIRGNSKRQEKCLALLNDESVEVTDYSIAKIVCWNVYISFDYKTVPSQN